MSSRGSRRGLTQPMHSAKQTSRGYAMIESLVALLLIALWVLAVAGAEVTTSRHQRSAGNRFIAVSLAAELGERMDGNLQGANAGHYSLAATGSAVSAGVDCGQAHCTPSELASHDLAQWTSRVVAGLPLRDVRVTRGSAAGVPVEYTIRIRWDEARGRQTYASEGTSETLVHELVKVIPGASP